MIIGIDVETTQLTNIKVPLREEPARISQICGCVFEDDGNPVFEISSFIKPDGWVLSAETEKITGVTTEHCEKYGLPISTLLKIIYQFIKKDPNVLIMAHNAKFDKRVVDSEYMKQGIDITQLEWLCTMEATRDIVKIPPSEKMLQYGFTGYKSPKLEESYEAIMRRPLIGNAHDASFDVKSMVEMMIELEKRQII